MCSLTAANFLEHPSSSNYPKSLRRTCELALRTVEQALFGSFLPRMPVNLAVGALLEPFSNRFSGRWVNRSFDDAGDFV
jgi:hypothetical protein